MSINSCLGNRMILPSQHLKLFLVTFNVSEINFYFSFFWDLVIMRIKKDKKRKKIFHVHLISDVCMYVYLAFQLLTLCVFLSIWKNDRSLAVPYILWSVFIPVEPVEAYLWISITFVLIYISTYLYMKGFPQYW